MHTATSSATPITTATARAGGPLPRRTLTMSTPSAPSAMTKDAVVAVAVGEIGITTLVTLAPATTTNAHLPARRLIVRATRRAGRPERAGWFRNR